MFIATGNGREEGCDCQDRVFQCSGSETGPKEENVQVSQRAEQEKVREYTFNLDKEKVANPRDVYEMIKECFQKQFFDATEEKLESFIGCTILSLEEHQDIEAGKGLLAPLNKPKKMKGHVSHL